MRPPLLPSITLTNFGCARLRQASLRILSHSGEEVHSRVRILACPARCPADTALPFVERPHSCDRVGFLRSLVGPVGLDAGEAERKAARIVRTRLDVVEGDLDEKLRADMDDMTVDPGGEALKPVGLPGEHRVGHAL